MRSINFVQFIVFIVTVTAVVLSTFHSVLIEAAPHDRPLSSVNNESRQRVPPPPPPPPGEIVSLGLESQHDKSTLITEDDESQQNVSSQSWAWAVILNLSIEHVIDLTVSSVSTSPRSTAIFNDFVKVRAGVNASSVQVYGAFDSGREKLNAFIGYRM